MQLICPTFWDYHREVHADCQLFLEEEYPTTYAPPMHHYGYLTNVLEVLDVMTLGAHDLIDDIGPHLVAVL